MMHKDMSNYQTYQYLATGLGYGIGFAVPIVVTYRTIFDVYNPNYFQSIMAGAIVGAAIRITGAVIAKVNKNKRLHKKDEIIAICNQLR
jgi:VIT1/CCC1 family predicted Fe2+/Mn2+ transporter